MKRRSVLRILLILSASALAVCGVVALQRHHRNAQIYALCAAAEAADVKAVRWLLHEGADPNGIGRVGNEDDCYCVETPSPAPPLHFAVYRVREDEKLRLAIVNALLDAGADPNRRGAGGLTPLMWANSPGLIRLLLKRGARTDLKDDRGYTALNHFTENRDQETMKILVAAGADKNARD